MHMMPWPLCYFSQALLYFGYFEFYLFKFRTESFILFFSQSVLIDYNNTKFPLS